MSIKESALSAITSISNGDFVRVVTSSGASRRITVANLANVINSKSDLSSSFSNSISTVPDSVSIIKNGNVAHVVLQYPSVSINNDTQIGTLPASVKSSSITVFKVIDRTTGAPIAGTCWTNARVNAIRYYGANISSTRIMIEGIVSLDT